MATHTDPPNPDAPLPPRPGDVGTQYRADDPVLAPGHSFGTITDKISSIVQRRGVSWKWLAGFAISFSLLMLLMLAVAQLFVYGVGVWGVNIPVAWGFAIVNFVWWVGIGHAGTLISAVLLLLRQEWRTSINRFAEAMTLFAVACAGMFPILHLGRPDRFYWIFPYPNTMGIIPQFRSPLVWDAFALTAYGTVSALFWYIGLIPDMASLRDRSKTKFGRYAYGMLSMGWRGSARHWRRYETAYLLLAGLATPLVVSVHTIVSFDFAASVIPGWHTTVFPPYFVAGAIYSGFAMVLTLAIPLRSAYGLKDFITDRHLDNMAKVMLASGLVVAYGYAMETFTAFYAGHEAESYMMINRFTGPYAVFYWALILCNILIPQLLWIPAVRRNAILLFVLALVINVGMWLERFVIVVTSLHRDYLPSSWGMFYPTFWDWAVYLGTIGFFLSCLFIFVRLLPAISIFEMRELLEAKETERETEREDSRKEDSHGR